jgi:hypothetical protein
MNALLLVSVSMLAACVGCGLFEPGGRYHSRDESCAVKTLRDAPPRPFVDLGIVSVDCWTGDDVGCHQELLDEACRRGGDVVWGLGAAAPSTSKLTAHVARTRPPAGAGN